MTPGKHLRCPSASRLPFGDIIGTVGISAVSFRRLLPFWLALSLSGCATDNLDWLGIAHDVTDADRRNYAALERERFPIAAADLAKLDPKFRRQQVAYKTSEPAGTIVVDTPNRYLYLVSGDGRALRYGIEVGREGFGWSGAATIARKAVEEARASRRLIGDLIEDTVLARLPDLSAEGRRRLAEAGGR